MTQVITKAVVHTAFNFAQVFAKQKQGIVYDEINKDLVNAIGNSLLLADVF